MHCTCGQTTVSITVAHSHLQRNGRQVAFEDVPAERCPACGELRLEPEAAALMVRLADASPLERMAYPGSQPLTPAEVQTLRAELALSQLQLGQLLGLSATAVASWEQGRRKPDGPSRVLLRLMAALSPNPATPSKTNAPPAEGTSKKAILAYLDEQLKEKATVLDAIHALEKLGLSQTSLGDQEWAVELGDEVTDTAKLEGKRLPAVPTRAETLTLLQVPDDPRDQLIFRTLYSTGLRVGELTTLVFADLRPTENSLFVRSGKGDKDRYALVDPDTMAQLVAWQCQQPPAAPVFPITDRQIERLVEKWGKKTGLLQKYEAMGRNLTPHSFRHAFATHCYENGMDLFTLKKLIGHDYLDTTEIYIEPSIAVWRAEYARTHPLAQQT